MTSSLSTLACWPPTAPSSPSREYFSPGSQQTLATLSCHHATTRFKSAAQSKLCTLCELLLNFGLPLNDFPSFKKTDRPREGCHTSKPDIPDVPYKLPFHLACRFPKATWKTVTDAWSGYHSVPLIPFDCPLTTFITLFGHWWYTWAPQGFLSLGDSYNCYFDALLLSFERKGCWVDNNIHHDSDLEQPWWRTIIIDFLTLVGQAGIVLNWPA